ncbi:AMP-dependent synthetase [Sphingobium sp. SCG-1]|uniref:class I adenylate-forming enzyme family protein n=1 Tax=Sphingobium sp. SCG-1 TaxID=2072936 RepID=UPI000CD678C3|nr:fatty acid--CoA ligase family protein [Sphingobium sp. SCG-1]AUW57131.1 AMP-dependent synthetase [Sphingobium sp. SCG-1]
MELPLLLEMGADAFPDRIAIAGPAGSVTLDELHRSAKGSASWLMRQAGDKLVYIGLNGPAFPLCLFSSGLAGRPFVPLNYRLPDDDLRRLLARTAPAVAVVDADMMPRVAGIEGIMAITPEQFSLHASEHSDAQFSSAEVNDTAILLFTSGTTGEPKAAILRHSNLTSYVISTVEYMGAGERDATLISVPPYHIAGISAALTNIYGGRRLAYLPTFTPEAWIQLAKQQGVTHAMVVPTMLGRILDVLQERGEALPALRALSYGGGRMPLPTIKKALEILPEVDFVNAYGLTETSSTIAILDPDDHRAAIASDDPMVRRRLSSVGRPLPTLELEIRDEAGIVCAAGVPGEVFVRGEQVSGEYLGRSALTADGWFPTNDAGWLDGAGYLFIEGRLDDVIVRGGENISPGEIEDVLREHEAIDDVAILGLPDNQWGERVAAAIVLKPGKAASQDELKQWVQARLRSTKTPETWDFRDALPYNDTGKVLRRTLKVEMAKALAND